MAHKRILTFLLFNLIIISIGCSSGEQEPVIESKSVMEGDPVITITFDGEVCDHQGPEITNGDELVLVFHGLDLQTNYPMFYRMEDGKTWEDFLALFPNDGAGGDGEGYITADWLKPVAGTTGENADEKIYTIKPGIYVTWCRIPSPTEIYPGGLLLVEE